MGFRIRMLLVSAAAVAALAVAGCGSDEETSATTSAETTSTTAAETSTTTTETTSSTGSAPTFEEASSALEEDGFDLDEKTGEELVQKAYLPKPITAVAGADATRPGSSGDVLIFDYADEADAKAYAKVNNDDLLTTEVVGTMTLTSTDTNTDLLDQALEAIGG